MKCQSCGSERIESYRGKMICKACGSEYREETAGRGSAGTSAYGSFFGRGEASMTGLRRPDPRASVKSAEVIYEEAIKGTASIQCYDHQSCGSGFLYRQNGQVITNAHVILNDKGTPSKNVTVTINDLEIKAQVVAYGNPNGSDVALLKMERVDPSQRPLKVGNSDETKIGARVYAIGNSLGEGLCITTGIISDKDREVFNESCFMSDVATNGGNSGGPLLNENGEVIAICVAGTNSAKGMNYFIPINDVLKKLKGSL